MGQLVKCAYCRGSGADRHKYSACSACGGSGQVMIPYDNYVTCNFCSGAGSDRYSYQPCRVCHGAGVTAPGIQIP